MTDTKYGNYVIREPFSNINGKPVFSYDNRDNIGVTYEYHCINRSDWAIEAAHTHENWELLCFLGGNPENIMDLGAEISVCLGDDSEEHLISSATVVSVPPGLKHAPVKIRNYTKPLVFLKISTTKEYEEKKAGQKKDAWWDAMLEGSNLTKDGKKHWMNIVQGPFFREKEPGYVNTSISAVNNEYRSGTTLGYHCIYPSYLAPTPHSHTHAELLCFLGGDPENVKDLNAEVTVCLGEEQEEHTFNTATIVSIPSDLKHCPVTVKNVSKPLIFLVICTAAAKVDVE